MYKKDFKIGIFWEQFEWGGVDSHIKYLLEGWHNKEDQFIIYYNSTNKGALRLKKEITKDNIIFKEYKTLFNSKKNYFNFILVPIKFYISIIKYKKFLYEEKLDIFIGENGGYPAAFGVLAAFVSAYQTKVPVRILVIHHEAVKQRLIMKLFRNSLDKTISKVASSIICVSKATLQSLKKFTLLFNNKNICSKVIYNCVPQFTQLSSKNIFNKKNDEKFIGILGRVEPYKGHDDLILAFSKLPETIKEKNKILIIGTGDEKNIIKLKTIIKKLDIEKYVFFKGFVDDKIENIIKSLSLVVMPTRSFEGFGYTIAEAMSVGVPVLASKVGAVEEFLSLNEGGLFQPGNTSELTENLIDFNKNHDKWEKRAIIAKNKINDKFDSKKVAKEFRDHLVFKYMENI